MPFEVYQRSLEGEHEDKNTIVKTNKPRKLNLITFIGLYNKVIPYRMHFQLCSYLWAGRIRHVS